MVFSCLPRLPLSKTIKVPQFIRVFLVGWDSVFIPTTLTLPSTIFTRERGPYFGSGESADDAGPTA